MELSKQSAELSQYVSKLLRDTFGKGPESVHVTIGQPYLTVYIRNFLSPTEKVLLSQQMEKTIQETRDTIMNALIPDIKANVKLLTGMVIEEFYYDWNFHNKSAAFIGICSDRENSSPEITKEYNGKELFHQELSDLSQEAQKVPNELYSYQLNHRTILVIRQGILIRIEKQLIRDGVRELLKISKRALEKALLHNNNHFEKILHSHIQDIFVDWDFDLDKSVTVFMVKPTNE